jgi:hypothetical protein
MGGGTVTPQPVTQEQIKILKGQGCTAEDFGQVFVAQDCDMSRFVDAHFQGTVKIGRLDGMIRGPGGVDKPCGIYNATLVDSTVGAHCRIANIGVHIANYTIGDNVLIEDVGTIQTNGGATFGNGIEASVLNEAGGREVILFDDLNVQFAYMLCLRRFRRKVVERLVGIARAYVDSVRSDRGAIGSGACIRSTAEILDVNIGPGTQIQGTSTLNNGTILSDFDSPTVIGSNVHAKDFIIAEYSSVTDAAMLEKVYVGQGCRIGKQFSAENCLFFANSEAFHGEAVSVFAGPYTVTHHKSTLLIAGLFSFYNAGSGTNQSNHMYKLGPVHEGKLLRGAKTGSFAYLMWPCVVGPFSVVLGKHTSTFDVSDFPFSHLEARPDGKCSMVAGLYLTTVGTIRDGAKWPRRDRRKGIRRDIISFEVLSPYTVGKMIKAQGILKGLQKSTDRSVEEVSVGGTVVRRLLLNTSRKYYRTAIEMYMLEVLVRQIEKSLDHAKGLDEAIAVKDDAVYSDRWVDIGGLLMPQDRLVKLEKSIEEGDIRDTHAFVSALQGIRQSYDADEWAWVRNMWPHVFDKDLADTHMDYVCQAVLNLGAVKTKFLRLVMADAEKEFSETSRCGFGHDGSSEDAEYDFVAVRGTYDGNCFVAEMKASVDKLNERVKGLVERITVAQNR